MKEESPESEMIHLNSICYSQEDVYSKQKKRVNMWSCIQCPLL